MRTIIYSLSLCCFVAAAVIAGAAFTLSPQIQPTAAPPQRPAAAEVGVERHLDRIAAGQEANAAIVASLRSEIRALQEGIALREAEAALEKKEERMALEEENRRLVAELQEAFESLHRESVETAQKEDAPRPAGEEVSPSALEQLRQTVDELRSELEAVRERDEASRPADGEAAQGKPESDRIAPPAVSPQAAGSAAPAARTDAGRSGTVIAVLGGGLFDVGENLATPDLERAVHRTLPAIVASPSSSIIVEGHTDAQPLSTELALHYGDNRTLSLMRAQTVADILVGAGVASSRITTLGLGSAHPIASNRRAAGRAENRRVEIRLVPAGQIPAGRAEPQEGG